LSGHPHLTDDFEWIAPKPGLRRGKSRTGRWPPTAIVAQQHRGEVECPKSSLVAHPEAARVRTFQPIRPKSAIIEPLGFKLTPCTLQAEFWPFSQLPLCSHPACGRSQSAAALEFACALPMPAGVQATITSSVTLRCAAWPTAGNAGLILATAS
jgi:hypothetical protein